MRKVTITPTQLESTSYLDNHMLLGSYKHVKDDPDDTDYPYTPSPGKTKGRNGDNQTYCDAPLSDASLTPLPTASLPPPYPDSPPTPGSLIWPPSSIASSDEKDDTAVLKERDGHSDDTAECGEWGLEGGGVEGASLKAESSQLETIEVLGEGGPPGPAPLGGSSGPSEELGPDPPIPTKKEEMRNLIKDSS
jgi:hypothetical protein